MLTYLYSPSHVPCMLFLCRMKSIVGQWLDKHAMFVTKASKRAGNVRSFPGPTALSGTFSPPPLCATLGQWRTLLGRLGELFEEAQLGDGLTYVLLFVRTSAALTRPSSPGRTRVMRPRDQRPRGTFLSTTNTMSPVAKFRSSRCHFRRSVRDGTYSWSQRFQKWFVITWACLHLFLLLMSRLVTTSIGRLLLAWPINGSVLVFLHPVGHC